MCSSIMQYRYLHNVLKSILNAFAYHYVNCYHIFFYNKHLLMEKLCGLKHVILKKGEWVKSKNVGQARSFYFPLATSLSVISENPLFAPRSITLKTVFCVSCFKLPSFCVNFVIFHIVLVTMNRRSLSKTAVPQHLCRVIQTDLYQLSSYFYMWRWYGQRQLWQKYSYFVCYVQCLPYRDALLCCILH